MTGSAKAGLVFIGGGRLAGMLYSTFGGDRHILGYVDDVNRPAYLTSTYGVPCLGTSETLHDLMADGIEAVVAITDAAARKKYGELLASLGFPLATLVFPTAVIDRHARVGCGCIIRHQAVVGAQVVLGDNCVVSDNAYVGHDSTVGRHTYISPGVNINGSVSIGEASFLGTGAVILPERRVGDGCTVGAAACVVRDVPDGQTVAGVPARPLPKEGGRTVARDDGGRAAPERRRQPGAPLISVLMAAYNHEAYVAEAIESALQQTVDDLELVVVDDGSSDGTADVIRGFDDERIRLILLGRNRGLVEAKRQAIESARGEYVAILNSDDAFAPDKLERQLAAFEDDPALAAVFTGVEVIDERGGPLARADHFYATIFDQPNRPREEWLRRFFHRGNCLCGPSMLAPRQLLLDTGYLDRRFRQLADFDLWVRLCLRHPIHIVPKALTRFRVRDGQANASAPTPETVVRDAWEYGEVLRRYLAIPSREELLAVFPEAATYVDGDADLDADGIAYVLARLALDHGGPRFDLFALRVLFDLFADEDRAAALSRRFGFGYLDVIRITGQRDVFGILAAHPPPGDADGR